MSTTIVPGALVLLCRLLHDTYTSQRRVLAYVTHEHAAVREQHGARQYTLSALAVEGTRGQRGTV